jgi:hypothetical protein
MHNCQDFLLSRFWDWRKLMALPFQFVGFVIRQMISIKQQRNMSNRPNNRPHFLTQSFRILSYVYHPSIDFKETETEVKDADAPE